MWTETVILRKKKMGRQKSKVLLAMLFVWVAFSNGMTAEAAEDSPRYSISSDGQEVTDLDTNLIWRRCAEGFIYSAGRCINSNAIPKPYNKPCPEGLSVDYSNLNYCIRKASSDPTTYKRDEAFARAKSVANAESKPWRVPTYKELESLYYQHDPKKRRRIYANDQIDPRAFPDTSKSGQFLSSEIEGPDAGPYAGQIRVVGFGSVIGRNIKPNAAGNLRLVR